VTVLALCVLAVLAHGPDNGNLLNFERMGAGAPAGWKVEQCNADWQAESGAARVLLGEGGRIELTSPARTLRRGCPHVLMFRMKSEPAGVRVSATLRDNHSENPAGLDASAEAGSLWQTVVMECVPANNAKDHYYLGIAIQGNNASFWIDDLWFGERPKTFSPDWRPAYRAVGLTLSPEAPWGVVAGNAPLRVRARASGAIGEGCLLRLCAIHTGGTVSEWTEPISTNGDFWESRLTLSCEAAARFGMIRLEGTVTATDGAPCSPMAETLLARVPEPVPGPCPDSPFGIHVALREPDLAAMAAFGYKWCRIHDASGLTKWGLIETAPGEWAWHDAEVDMARRHGLSILGMFDSAPPWETGADEDGYFGIYHAPKSLDRWRNYVRTVAGHYAGRIDEWEVWNEPWDMNRFFQGGTPGRYVELLKAAHEEAKAANPACTIIGVDTYPPFWDAAVLAAGAYPHYDLLSWHRYDPSLQGRPNDAPARVAKRLKAVQAWYGTPKPTIATEGGIDVALFQGSFFSFADPAIVGDWSEGADRYVRLFLGAIAAGHRRFIAYSVHNPPRHGKPTHMMSEPEPLARPLHAALAALAHFVEGATYRERLIPAHDISAHVFGQPHPRSFAEGPCTVVALIADGAEEEPLPKPLPAGIRCYDRWGNPVEPPSSATRAITYLVTDTANTDALLDVLRGTETEGGPQSIAELLQTTAQSLGSEQELSRVSPELGRLFSAQGSLLLAPGKDAPIVVTRAMMRRDASCIPRIQGPAAIEIAALRDAPAGPFRIGTAKLASEGKPIYTLFFTATPDGPGSSWRFLTLALMPADSGGASDDAQQLKAIAERWAAALRDASTANLHGLFHEGPKCVAAATLNGEYFVFDNPEYLITMLDTAVLLGKAPVSKMTFQEPAISDGMAVLSGRWDIVALPFGIAAYPFTAAFCRTRDGWRLASFCMGC